MSRYVDLDGNTWDGTPITSKIQEVKTKWGYMQGITIGWLWGDNVPHIDLEEHDKEVIQNYINNVVEELEFLENNTFRTAISDAYTSAIEIIKRGGNMGKVFTQKINGDINSEIKCSFETVGIIVRAKIERLCNEHKFEEAEELEKAIEIVKGVV